MARVDIVIPEPTPKYTEEDDCMEAVYMELTASGNLIRVIERINTYLIKLIFF